MSLKKRNSYSYFNVFTGFEFAALIEFILIVIIAMKSATKPDNPKIQKSKET